MEITVNRLQMIREIERDKKKYEKQFTKSVNIYKKKLKEYARYVGRIAQKSPMIGLKSPPYPPTSNVIAFEDSLEMLHAHVPGQLNMDDSEYKHLTKGIRASHAANAASINELSSLSY